MSVYMIVEMRINDPEPYAKYVDQVASIVERHGGRYLARGGQVVPLSGEWDPERIILIEFDSAEQAQRCFSSPEYLALAPLREQSTVSKAILVEGC